MTDSLDSAAALEDDAKIQAQYLQELYTRLEARRERLRVIQAMPTLAEQDTFLLLDLAKELTRENALLRQGHDPRICAEGWPADDCALCGRVGASSDASKGGHS